MTDRRRYTATPRPQVAWSGLALSGAAAAVLVAGPVGLAVGLGAWVAGLVALGLWDRRRWRRLVADSGFERREGPNREDLERIVDGRSVTIETAVDGPLAGGTATVETGVEGVAASFTALATTESGALVEGAGTATVGGFAVQGGETAVETVISGAVRERLGAVELPGTLTVTGERVRFETPVTRPTSAELRATAALVVAAAERVEVA